MKNNGISFMSLLAVAFIVLKLCKVIDWSWWYVTLPLWGGIALFLIFAPFYIWFKLKHEARKKREIQYTNSFKTKSKFQERLEAMQKQSEQR